ncbi:5a0228b4-c442-4caf-9b9e-b8f33cb9e2d8 [Sclerotinia trifoliorum]|uniref:5a0228b4-c442-4caf-9b9e-b8f33cb9e2d8 n=1 Tax=Sclerotinia trifoliorum TaxID=28548 RepID=A0A8H2VTD7_9HELO|nr:5a0228b4-c442-4caf-9b9e-b8f33cb9e2d8 [Sclerotinia trifoliorum]
MTTAFLQRLKARCKNNVAAMRDSPLAEISGAFGDLGTLLPLMIALAVNNSISLSTTLVFSGLWNILTGIAFGIPLPVQPMKAIAAVAISRKFSIEETVSAGYTVAGVVLILSGTGLLRWFTCMIPTPVVKGIQVGAGLSLVLSAGSSLLQPLGFTTPNAADNLIWALFAFIALLLTQRFQRFPYALAIFLLGLVLSLYITGLSSLPSFKLWHPQIYIPSGISFKVGALDAGLGQIPLTTLNSIIAVNFLAADLLPNIPAPGVTSIGLSVAFMNLIGGWFGAMPVCHGSGGLAAQYRFGARSGASIIMLGTFKMILGFFFGDTLVGLLKHYPKSLLGIMVVAAGLELAKVGESLNYGARDLWEISESSVGSDSTQPQMIKRHRQLSDEERKERWTVMFITIGFLLAFKNDGVGFLAGMLCHGFNQSSRLQNTWEGWRTRYGERKTKNATSSLRDEEEQLLSGA